MEEIWKDIPGYEGLYQVSNFGNIKSLNWKNMGKAKNMYLKPHCHGYLQIELFNNGVKKTYMVHRLVAQSFIDNPGGYPFVNHKDENKTNNCAWNLEWCTAKYNSNYGTLPQRISERCKNDPRISKAVFQYKMELMNYNYLYHIFVLFHNLWY